MARTGTWVYLLKHLSGGMQFVSADREGCARAMLAMQLCGNHLGVKIGYGIWYRGRRSRKDGALRIFFTAPMGQRDDEFAEKLAESILLLYGPIADSPLPYEPDSDSPLAHPFQSHSDVFSDGVRTTVLLGKTDDVGRDSAYTLMQEGLSQCCYLPDIVIAALWKFVPVLHEYRTMRFAAAFFWTAQQVFCVSEAEAIEKIRDNNWSPSHTLLVSMWETAFHNYFKTVEAIVGDPSRNESKLREQLKRAGLNVEELVGYRQKQSIIDVIRNMNDIRDSRAAHGSTPQRGLSLHEMVEFSACARYVLLTGLETKLARVR